jgi:hypothetical protein
MLLLPKLLEETKKVVRIQPPCSTLSNQDLQKDLDPFAMFSGRPESAIRVSIPASKVFLVLSPT